MDDLQLKLIKNKRRILGNIRFIGELFKLQMLIEQIMHDCIFKLLCSKDEESLECMSNLMSTIGKILDHEKAKVGQTGYLSFSNFSTLTKLGEERALATNLGHHLKLCCEPKNLSLPHFEVSRSYSFISIAQSVSIISRLLLIGITFYFQGIPQISCMIGCLFLRCFLMVTSTDQDNHDVYFHSIYSWVE